MTTIKGKEYPFIPLCVSLSCSVFASLVCLSGNASAQVISDGSVGSTVSAVGNNYTIDNGTQVGSNLFHSFSQFSVPTGGSANFNNALTVQTIFARVTGGTVSNIDGLLKANGSASLFLLNPSGILFGANASLNIGGSFIASTADSVIFADGVKFNATEATAPALLTVSVPVGLQMGSNPGTITVQGSGSQLIDITGFGQASTINSPIGLQAGANQTLALIGGVVNFSGGVASIQASGHLEVGSVKAGTVGLTATSTGWVGNYATVSQFNDIHLAQDSMLNASGSNGSIQMQGQNISLSEGSALLLQNLVGSQSSGGITVNARGSLTLRGNTANGELGSLIQSNNLGTGSVGDITVSAANLSLQDGARIVSRTRSQQAAGANINLTVSDATEISGFTPSNPAVYSGIVSFSASNGKGGNITVATKNLSVLDSGNILAIALRSGDSGTIQVNAAEQVKIAGYNPLAFAESSLSTFTQGSGNASNAIINTGRLIVQGGASLGSSTVASGSTGSVEVNASESIDVQGRALLEDGTVSISRISSNAEILNLESQIAFGLPAIPTGNAGSLTINTPSLRITDGGAVSVKNDGPGLAGNVQIIANSTFLDHQSSITAVAQSGEGGDIVVQGTSLILRHGSLISATAGGTGNGGNITINASVIAGFENSDIVANAVRGRGGNIQITTQGIFGLKFRPQLTPQNDITASSQFGVSGTVQVNDFGVDPASGLVQLPTGLVDPSQKIAAGCAGNKGNSFVATGRGGLPPNPTQDVNEARPWTDTRDISAYQKAQAVAPPVSQAPAVIAEATTWRRTTDGHIELVAENVQQPTIPTTATCASALVQ